ncbi:hypothetical protein H0H81_007478 [Sphagnurus paluster]|uniref:Uncharacterized protein n=1 Tax=Sphagnurus paluster TaxID=117069 RepID=A0A9P7GQ09_9AGAR|nr:hypothetical protein H0H81_007478 [Sphagnurus paluster]
MATRRRIGVSLASTEAARRQLMQPVPCWEKVWVRPENNTAGSTLKVYKWIKTEKLQQFSDDEGEVDEPLAPLPDEPEVIEGDDEIEQDEPLPENAVGSVQSSALATTQESDDLTSKPPSPKPQLSISLQNTSQLSVDQPEDMLDASLKPFEETMDIGMDLAEKSTSGDGIGLDISNLGADELALEASHDLPLGESDTLMGGQLMDHSTDPFAPPIDE